MFDSDRIKQLEEENKMIKARDEVQRKEIDRQYQELEKREEKSKLLEFCETNGITLKELSAISSLKLCPFCGGKAVLTQDHHQRYTVPSGYYKAGAWNGPWTSYRVVCTRCENQGPLKYLKSSINVNDGKPEWWTSQGTAEEAITAWNRRVNHAKVQRKD